MSSPAKEALTRATTALGRFGRKREGSAAVEFGLTATILASFLAGIVDLTLMSSMNREVERSSALVAALFTSCEAGTSCVTDTIDLYKDRIANTLVQYPKATVSMIQIKKVSGTMLVCSGNTTYLDADVATSAANVFEDNDEGFAVVIQVSYLTFLPFTSSLLTLTSTTVNGVTGPGKTFRSWTTAVRTSTGKVSC
ncbi:MAG: hypothetical protein K2Y56_00120 [Methylobacterium sp.]|uniref:TadE/TadG family type IV pilus assembly protein n=1 Tax=Methylobacterium sp. TaxID=409 RepID=UPI0025D694CB|nr:hypothetical protein [Methylobacterium sp.]MBX9929944.1 hypothetical protein [Methylobacterium sp.]